MKYPMKYCIAGGNLGEDGGAFDIPFEGRNLHVIASNGEQWLPIHGYEDLYMISTLGRVMALQKDILIPNGGIRHHNKSILTPEKMKKGYLRIALKRNAETKRILIHRLVAEHFIPNPTNLLQINHIDSRKNNNHVENLEWCSSSYNLWHAIEKGRNIGIKIKDIILIKELLDKGKTINELADIYNKNTNTISDIKHGRHRKLDPENTHKWNGLPHWNHVSVSLGSRCPNWKEMSFIKDLFFDEEDCVIQYHPPKSMYKNVHPYCLHLWQPQNDIIPMPPLEYV